MRFSLRQPVPLFVTGIALVSTGALAAAPSPQRISDLQHKHLTMCQGRPAISSARHKKMLLSFLQASGEANVLSKKSPQNQAACWMIYQNKKTPSGPKLLQRYALAIFYYATHQTKPWDWSMATGKTHATGYWMTPARHECSWYGVICNWRHHVTRLDLGFLAIDGLLPRELGLLTSLQDLDLHGNDLQGVLPHKLLHGLQQLRYLRLHMNGFFGNLAREISNLRQLRELHIFGNYLAGSIPRQLAELRHLQVLDLYANQLTGTIPSELAKLPLLRRLDVHDNDLVGRMPSEICRKKLPHLVADCLGPRPEVECSCCTICCRGLPDPKCVEVKSGKEVLVD